MPSNTTLKKAFSTSPLSLAQFLKKLDRKSTLSMLRRQIERIDHSGDKFLTKNHHVLSIGDPLIDQKLPGGGLAIAGLHEINMIQEDGAAIAFAATLAARRILMNDGIVLWCTARRGLYGPGLASFGISLDRLLIANGRDDEERLWVIEEALRCRRIVAVVGEINTISQRQSRRLHLSAKLSNTTGFLLRPPTANLSVISALTRWRAISIPGNSIYEYGGVRMTRIRLNLLRARGGVPANWHLEWRNEKWNLLAKDQYVQKNIDDRKPHTRLSSHAIPMATVLAT